MTVAVFLALAPIDDPCHECYINVALPGLRPKSAGQRIVGKGEPDLKNLGSSKRLFICRGFATMPRGSWAVVRCWNG